MIATTPQHVANTLAARVQQRHVGVGVGVGVGSSSTSRAEDAEPDAERVSLREAGLLLACFEELAGRQPSALDQQAARELVEFVQVGRLISAMRARAERNGPNWRPASLAYFRGMARDMAGSAPMAEADRPIVYGLCESCRNAGVVAIRDHPVLTSYQKCPECLGYPPRDVDLDPDWGGR